MKHSVSTKITKLRKLVISCLLLLVVLLALYATIAKQLIVWVSDYKIQLESKLSETLHTPVSIGELKGSWDIFSPTLTAYKVHIGDQIQKLEVDQLTIEIDIPKSILNWQIRVAAIHGENLNLQIRENKPDIWSIGGIPRQETPITPEIVLTQLQRFYKISITNSTISIYPYNQPTRTFTHTNATLTHFTDEDMRLDGILHVNEDKPIILSINATINPTHWYQLDASLYADIPYLDWLTWLPEPIISAWNIKQSLIGGQLWASIKNGGIRSTTFSTQNTSVALQYKQNKPVTLKDINTTVWFNNRNQRYTQLLIDNLSLKANETPFTNIGLNLTKNLLHKEEQWNIEVKNLNITNIVSPALLLSPIPEETQEIIRTINPTGLIQDLQATWLPNKPLLESINFKANLDKISFNPYNNTVGAGNISGLIEGDLKQGQLALNADDFSLFIASIYSKPWPYHHATADLRWSYDDNAISIFSPLMKLKGDEGDLSGDMMIRLYPKDPIKDYMDLRVNIANGNASYTPKYIPSKANMDSALVQWLNTAIIKGDIETGFFQYQGSIAKGTPNTAHNLLLYMKTMNTEVNYHPPWPSIQQIEGEVFLEPSGIRILASKGTISESQLTDINVNIPHVNSPAITRLYSTANIQTTVNDTLHILKSSPPEIAHVFKDWQGNGNLTGDLELNIPLKKNQQPIVITTFTTKNAMLDLQHPVPPLTNITGTFKYDSRSGLSSPSVSAYALGSLIQGVIAAKGDNTPISQLTLKGIVDINNLANWYLSNNQWPFSGKTPYNMEVTIGKNNQLKINSDLKGININLPAPFNKISSDTKNFSYEMETGQNQPTTLAFSYGTLINTAITMDKDQRNWQGELLINQGKANFTNTKGLEVRGNLDNINLEEWKSIYKKYSTIADHNPSQQHFNINEIRNINILIGQVTGFKIPPQQAAIYIQPMGEQGWRLDINSPSLSGRLTAPQVKNLPYYVHLNYLKLPDTVLDLTKEKTPSTLFDMKNIPDINIAISQLFLGKDFIGRVKFNNTHHEQGVKISDIDLNLKGIHIKGDLDWQVGKRTTFNGSLSAKDLEKVLKNWNINPNISAKSFKLAINGTWLGPPTNFSPEHFTGSLALDIKSGRILSFDDSSSNILRILGILNLEAITKQLRLDFTDFYKPGLAFNSITGEFKGVDGLLTISKPLNFIGPSMMMSLTGQGNLQTKQVNANLKVGIPLGSSISIATLAVTPPIGGAMLIVDYFFGNELMKLAAVNYTIKGNWNNPTVTLGHL